MTNKEKYRLLCEEEASIPIFSQAWWLDSVAGDNWDVVLIEKKGKIQASLPYTSHQRLGLTIISQPALTQNLGPWIRISTAKYAKQLSQEKELIQKLFSELPNFARYSQNWHLSRTNWIPLFWLGYEQTTRYTYVITNVMDLDAKWAEIDSAYRNKIRKAEKLVEVKHNLTLDAFYRLNTKTFLRQGMAIPYSLQFLSKHHDVLRLHDACKIFYAVDSSGEVHSALYLTWDALSSYVHLVGEDPELRKSGAGILLIWEAIKFTATTLKLNKFDFEGSMLEPIEKVRRDFGARQTPYFTISKTNSKLLKLRNFLQGVRGWI